MSVFKIPRGMRAFEIGLGILIAVLSAIVIINPISGFLSIIWIVGILLFVIGIEMIVSHIFTHQRSRFAGISLGIVVIILATIAIAFPLITSIIVIALFGVALLFSGVSKIIHGVNNRQRSKWNRGFSVAAGVFSIFLAIMILVFPVFGIAFAGLLIGISLLITGIQMISSGLSGKMVDNSLKDLR
jgi:uncharacterized membrane protein HdeD (DUF308 family)